MTRKEYTPSCACGARWTGLTRAHCSGCHLTFSGITAFDLHRRGGGCVDPSTLLALVQDEAGTWGYPSGDGGWVERRRAAALD
jgi:hypothetical protein